MTLDSIAETVPFIAAAVLLAAAFVTDVRKHTISNRLTLSFFGGAVLFHLISSGWQGGADAATGAAAGFVPLLLLHMAKGIGAGDVKLFGALGAWIGSGAVLQMVLYSILYAGLIGLLLVTVYRSFSSKLSAGMASLLMPGDHSKKRQWLAFAESGSKFPFMLAVAPAAITVWTMLP